MFIAMNRFKVVPGRRPNSSGCGPPATVIWAEVPGFVAFHLLRGPEHEHACALFVAYLVAQPGGF